MARSPYPLDWPEGWPRTLDWKRGRPQWRMKLTLDKLRELALAATPGPWVRVDPPWGQSDWVVATSSPSGDPHGGTSVCDCDMLIDRADTDDRSHENAAFIAAANPATVIAMIDEIRRLKRTIAALGLREMCAALLEACNIATRVIGDVQILPSTDSVRVDELRRLADAE